MDRSCEVWLATTDLLRPEHVGLLDERERRRAEAFSQPADKSLAWLSAVLFRVIAARTLCLDPVDPEVIRRIDVDRTCPACDEPHGKPSIGHGVHLSVSHAGSMVAVAVTRVAPVGIDLELSGRGTHAQVAARWACTPEERARIEDSNDALRYWVRKEAIVKAAGEGLKVPLGNVHVSSPGEPARLVRWSGRPDQECTLVDLDPPDSYVASLAVLSNGPLRVIERSAGGLLAA